MKYLTCYRLTLKRQLLDRWFLILLALSLALLFFFQKVTLPQTQSVQIDLFITGGAADESGDLEAILEALSESSGDADTTADTAGGTRLSSQAAAGEDDAEDADNEHYIDWYSLVNISFDEKSILHDGHFSLDFERVPSRTTLTDDVKTGRADCGFIIGEDESKIICVTSSKTTKSELAKETVFAAWYRMRAEQMLVEMSKDPEVYDDSDATGDRLVALLEQFRDYLEKSDELFKLEFITIGGSEEAAGGGDEGDAAHAAGGGDGSGTAGTADGALETATEAGSESVAESAQTAGGDEAGDAAQAADGDEAGDQEAAEDAEDESEGLAEDLLRRASIGLSETREDMDATRAAVTGLLLFILMLILSRKTYDPQEIRLRSKLTRRSARIYNWISIAAPGVILAAAFTLVQCLADGHILQFAWRFILTWLFTQLTALWLCVLQTPFRSSLAYDSFLPAAAMLIAVLSPVFVDLSVFAPALKYVQYLSPVTWYIHML